MNVNINNMFNNIGDDNNFVDNLVQNKPCVNPDNNIDAVTLLKLLNPGDVFSAQILDIVNPEVSILLDNGEQITAKMQQTYQFNIGDKLMFQVKDNSDNEIILKPFGQNQISEDLIKKSLLNAGITINDKNKLIVSELIKNGQPIDKQSIQSVIRTVNTYKNEDIDKLIFMNKYNIKISNESLLQFDNYSNYQHKINDCINNLSEEFINVTKNQIYDNETNINELSDKLKDISEILDDNHMITEAKNADKLDIKSDNIINQQSVNSEINSKVIQEDNLLNKFLLSYNRNNMSDKEGNVKTNFQDDLYIKNNELNNIQVKDGLVNYISSKNTIQSVNDVIKFIVKNKLPDNLVSDIVKSDTFTNVIKRVFDDKLKVNLTDINPENGKFELKNDIENLYEKLNKITLTLESQSNKTNNSMMQACNSLKENITFMNELNHMSTYVQIPLKLSEGSGHSDLYVYNRKKGKFSENEQITAFLHLELENLGATDVNITMKNKNITTKFALVDRESCKLVEKHLDELSIRLKKLGFNVELGVDIKENDESKNTHGVIDNVIRNDSDVVSIKRYTFDIRT